MGNRINDKEKSTNSASSKLLRLGLENRFEEYNTPHNHNINSGVVHERRPQRVESGWIKCREERGEGPCGV